MEIQNFKMRATPEQSRIVQQTLFNNGCQWQDSSKQVILLTIRCLLLRNAQLSWASAEDYEEKDLPELTFQEFFDRYVKWCVKVTAENREFIYQWKFNEIRYSSYIKPDYYINSDWSWSPEPSNSRVELTFEQFEKYVLKSKDMEKVEFYKLKKECQQYEAAAAGICADGCKKLYGNVGYHSDIEKLKKAGVLDLWFEPVYRLKVLYFGKVKFTIHEGYADTEYGKVTKEEISKVFDYISDAPGLVNGKHKLVMPIHDYSKIKFGCQEGTVKELEDIYKAM